MKSDINSFSRAYLVFNSLTYMYYSSALLGCRYGVYIFIQIVLPQKEDVRVIFGNFYEGSAFKVFCKVSNKSHVVKIKILSNIKRSNIRNIISRIFAASVDLMETVKRYFYPKICLNVTTPNLKAFFLLKTTILVDQDKHSLCYKFLVLERI